MASTQKRPSTQDLRKVTAHSMRPKANAKKASNRRRREGDRRAALKYGASQA